MDWSYIAGYFDGEGSVGVHRTARGQMTQSLTWHNTHRESLEAMHAFMGFGSVKSRSQTGLGKKPQFVLSISRKRDLLVAIDAMLPHVMIKRDAMIRMRDHLLGHVDDSRMVNFGKAAAATTEQLSHWYVDEGLSQEKIATRLGVTAAAVNRVFRLRGIESRPAGGASLRGTTKSAETRARMKASRQALWKDPKFRRAQLANLRKGSESRRKLGP